MISIPDYLLTCLLIMNCICLLSCSNNSRERVFFNINMFTMFIAWYHANKSCMIGSNKQWIVWKARISIPDDLLTCLLIMNYICLLSCNNNSRDRLFFLEMLIFLHVNMFKLVIFVRTYTSMNLFTTTI